MLLDRSRNRKLLVSVFNAQEAREAVVGGARIVDSEDPRSALGNIKPRHIMDIARSVLDHKRDREVQLSTNIGEDQLLFDRTETGEALQKSPYEIEGKASQAALGVATSMGTQVHDCPIIKVGVDGMNVDLVRDVLGEVVLTLQNSQHYSSANVMSVLFAQDLNLWDERKHLPYVRHILVGLREFHYSEANTEDVFDLMDDGFLVKTIRDSTGQFVYSAPEEIPRKEEVIRKLTSIGVLPTYATDTTVELNELFPHGTFFPNVDVDNRRTNRDVIAAMVDVTRDAGAHSIMLDTRIQTKVARISLAKTSGNGLLDINRFDKKGGIAREGVLPLEDLRFFVDYCHFRGVEANLAGSFQSYQAQQVWPLLPQLDQISTRGGSSAVQLDPRSAEQGTDTRQFRVTQRNLVRGLVPPEQGGLLNIPDAMRKEPDAEKVFPQLKEMISSARRSEGLPELKAYFVNRYGQRQSF